MPVVGRGLVLWRRCDTLRTSGFVDDGIFSHKNVAVFRRVLSIPKRRVHIAHRGERSLQSTIELRCIVTDLPQNELMPELHGFDLLRIRRSTVQQIEPVASEREPD